MMTMMTTITSEIIMLYMSSITHNHPEQQAMMWQQSMFGNFVNPNGHDQDCSRWHNWCADNGAFGYAIRGEEYNHERFMAMLRRLLPWRGGCRFVVVPDVPFNWSATLDKFNDWRKTVYNLGYPLALAVQDGAMPDNIPWDDIDAVFIGGSTEWKRSQPQVICDDLPLFSGVPAKVIIHDVVPQIIAEAKRRGKWAHMGRQANSPQQILDAWKWGADSVDGTCLSYAPRREFRWIARTMWMIHNRAVRVF